MKKKSLIAIAVVGSVCWLGISTMKKPDCSSWHNMSVESNEAKARQNEISREHGWHVELTNLTLPKQITAMTVEVCKYCGQATAVTMKYKTEINSESIKDVEPKSFLEGVYYAACAHNGYYYEGDSNAPPCNNRPISDWYRDAIQIRKKRK